MIIRVDPDAALPVYEQIRLQIQRMAVSGTLPAGARLPTIRQLAADLGLAKGTVSRAYEMLDADRVIESRGRQGTYVAEMTVTVTEGQDERLARAAEAFAVIARQFGVDEDDAHAALSTAWDSLN